MMVGVMDKIGTFGMIRFCLGLFPEASQWATPVVLVLAVLSILYGAILAIGSRNLMRFVAYTSISHFGFIVLGIFVLTRQTLTGSTFYMLNHGLSTAALFLVAGYLVKRRGSADINDFGGVQKVAPVAAGLLLFAGSVDPVAARPVQLRQRVHGAGRHVRQAPRVRGGRDPGHRAGRALHPADVPAHHDRAGRPRGRRPVTDVTARERLAIAPLVVLILVLGVYPKPVLSMIEPSTALLQTSAGVSDPAPLVGGTR